MAKKATTTKAAKTFNSQKAAARTAPAGALPGRNAPASTAPAPEGDHTHLASPAEETKMREQATKPAAVKEALKAGKKDPIEKFGDPDADPVDTAIRRANFG